MKMSGSLGGSPKSVYSRTFYGITDGRTWRFSWFCFPYFFIHVKKCQAIDGSRSSKTLKARAQCPRWRPWTVPPYIVRQWLEAWDRVIPFFDFSANVRRLVYTTNATESLNRDLRKVVKIRASFPTETAAMKLLYLAVRKIEKAAMRELAIEFGDRITPYID